MNGSKIDGTLFLSLISDFGTEDQSARSPRSFFSSFRLPRMACESRQNGLPKRDSRRLPCGDRKSWQRHRQRSLQDLFWMRRIMRYNLRIKIPFVMHDFCCRKSSFTCLVLNLRQKRRRQLFYSSLKDLARLKQRRIRTRLSIGQSSITSYLTFLLSFSGLNGPLRVFY